MQVFSSDKIVGYYLDGKTPRKHPVSIQVKQDGVRYSVANNAEVSWPFSLIDWSQSPLNQRPLFLRKLDIEDACLVFVDQKAIDLLIAAKKTWARNNYWLVYAEQKNIFLTWLAVIAVSGFLWLAWPPVADVLAAHASPEFRRMVDHLGDDYLADEKICTTPEAEEALHVIQNRLAQGNPQLQNLKLIIIQKKAVNAYTLPGNQVVLTRGLLSKAENGDEVAGVVAHEFGHVLNDHIMRGVLRNIVPKFFALIFSKIFGPYSQIADMFVGNAYSRGFERDADATALQLLQRAQISPQGLEQFFTRLEGDKKNPLSKLAYLSDHPAPEDRVSMIQEALSRGDVGQSGVIDATQFKALKDACGVHTRGIHDN